MTAGLLRIGELAAAAGVSNRLHALGRDLDALRELAGTSGTAAHTMATTLMVRAHHLVVTATELLLAMPEGA